MNVQTPFIHKRIEFQHESEFRLLIVDHDYNENLPQGIFVKVNLVKLIEEIILPPKIADDTKKNIVEMISDNGYHFNIRPSKMSSEALF